MNKAPLASCLALISAFSVLASPSVAEEPTGSTWSGFYIGAHGGYGWGDLNAEDSDGSGVDVKGGLVGGHLGYLWQFQSFVVGVEGDMSYSTIGEKLREVDGPESIDFEAKNRWLASIRARSGVDVGPALLYATGGIAWTDWSIDETYRISGVDGVERFKAGSTDVGFVLGGGVEVKLTQSIIARLEGLHYRFSGMDVTFEEDGDTETFELEEDITTVRGGLSVQF